MNRILTDEEKLPYEGKLPYYPIYVKLMKLPSMQARQSGVMVLAADIYKLVRAETLKEVGELLDCKSMRVDLTISKDGKSFSSKGKGKPYRLLTGGDFESILATLKSGEIPE